jgi:hypothetical protein
MNSPKRCLMSGLSRLDASCTKGMLTHKGKSSALLFVSGVIEFAVYEIGNVESPAEDC